MTLLHLSIILKRPLAMDASGEIIGLSLEESNLLDSLSDAEANQLVSAQLDAARLSSGLEDW